MLIRVGGRKGHKESVRRFRPWHVAPWARLTPTLFVYFSDTLSFRCHFLRRRRRRRRRSSAQTLQRRMHERCCVVCSHCSNLHHHHLHRLMHHDLYASRPRRLRWLRWLRLKRRINRPIYWSRLKNSSRIVDQSSD